MARLLVVDDDPVQRQKVVRAAREVGFDEHEIVEAINIDQARTRSEGLSLDFAVVDIVLTELPEKEGLGLVEELRVRHPHCKIIGLTSKGGTDFGIKALKAGADDFVSTKWEYVNWYSLLVQRLAMWRGVVEEGLAATS